MKQLQIGIMGSAADLKYNEDTLNFAKKIGELIAKSNNILVYGVEKDYTSLSTEAAKVATKFGGITVGVAGGKDKNVYGEYRPTVLINSGLEIGGGRVFRTVPLTFKEFIIMFIIALSVIPVDWIRKIIYRKKYGFDSV